ncbi:DMT family transporter [Undibacter mobilis]|uniref:EamA/RhaT family transporter n=1 Tax=Undibacter mobilis TaxID=2292256 RepID=A0A371B9P1_9BRAD|nr:EamA family transporter [Undibacter mobilis]RDV04252.1 EamA/RhaT family transporter [Undibacter mobilis]
MSDGSPRGPDSGTARLSVVLLAFCWGLVWIATAVALREVEPWTLRMVGVGGGAATLFLAARVAGFDLYVPPRDRIHVLIAGFFNVGTFHILSAFAQLNGATSRTIIVIYTMPIWAAVLSMLLLHDKLGRLRLIALTLGVAGIGILIWPLLAHGIPVFIVYSLTAAIGWAFGTVYMKWRRSSVPALANAAWQLLFGFFFLLAGALAFEGLPRLWPISTNAVIAIVYLGVIGVGLAHFLWWSIIGRLSPLTASIGVLLVPVVGVTASIVILGERPTGADIVGFVLIFAAAACVLLPAGDAADKAAA